MPQNPKAKIGIYNKEGELIEEKRREEVDKREDILKSVIILAVNKDDEVYVVNLGEDGLYDETLGGSAAGLVRVNESVKKAALRTTKRELGIKEQPTYLTDEFSDLQGIKRFANYYYFQANQEKFDIDEERERGEWRSKKFIEENFDKFLPTFKTAFEEIKFDEL